MGLESYKATLKELGHFPLASPAARLFGAGDSGPLIPDATDYTVTFPHKAPRKGAVIITASEFAGL